MDRITIRKLDHSGEEKATYSGSVLWRREHELAVSTAWERPPLDTGYVFLDLDDRWTEHFYDNHWYNIFEIRTVTGALRGWYCNVTRPVRIDADTVDWEDLALDLWVDPDGTMRVLDKDEFEDLPISQREREHSRAALAELKMLVEERRGPFSAVGPGRPDRASSSV